MSDPRHSKQGTADGIHTAIAYVYADAAARTGATGFGAGDVTKLALQSDSNTIWMLSSTAPTWAPVSTGTMPPADDTFVFAASGIGTSTTARYLVFGYTPNQAPVSRVALSCSRAGVLSNLRVVHNLSGTGGALTYTLRVNGVDTALLVTATAGSAGGSDTTHAVSVAATDLIELRVTKAGAIALSPSDITATMEFNT